MLHVLTTIFCVPREYLPELIPVEVPEPKAKEWFQSLLSGIQFLHDHGVVHNDIKYAHQNLLALIYNLLIHLMIGLLGR